MLVKGITMFRIHIRKLKQGLIVSMLALGMTFAMPQIAIMQAVYDCGTYSSGAYDENCPEDGPGGGGDTGGQQGGGSTNTGGGNLSDTGSNTHLYGIIGVVCLATSIGLFIATNRKNQKSK